MLDQPETSILEQNLRFVKVNNVLQIYTFFLFYNFLKITE